MRLVFPAEQMTGMIQQARAALPAEACGVLAAHRGRICAVLPVRNVAQHPQQGFVMEPGDLVRALYRVDRAGWTLAGFYHSHPAAPALPSPADVAVGEGLPGLAQVIISLQDPRRPQVQAWCLRPGEVERMAISTAAGQLPEEEKPLSGAGQAAVLLTALLALLVVVGTAVLLLPPAPVLPPAAP
ncbi:MAG: Mov34/MPN/PAD-1 family protein [Anaerolineae bacterium]|nr:Mov34/MPN/PAD-1 family protein [Anaerolineae bacterium]